MGLPGSSLTYYIVPYLYVSGTFQGRKAKPATPASVAAPAFRRKLRPPAEPRRLMELGPPQRSPKPPAPENVAFFGNYLCGGNQVSMRSLGGPLIQ